MDNNRTITIQDKETGQEIKINNPSFFGPVINKLETAYTDSSCSINIGGTVKNLEFKFPDKPTEEYELAMWNTLDTFEKNAWEAKNVGITTGFKTIDDGFEGGLFPGFIVIGGDSNLGKSAMISQMAYNMATLNNNVYVMDFSLDDSMPDKLSRIAACSGRLTINAVKTPLNYKEYPLMLIRRKNSILNLRNLVGRYRAYDSSFSTFIEDIEKEIEKQLIYFDANNIDKKVVVVIDSFHDLNIASEPNLTDKNKYDRLGQWCSDLAIKYNIVVLCSAELRKINGKGRPDIDQIRESVKIKYEAKAVLLVYNDVHYKGENADVFFMKNNNPYKQPIFEVHFAKNKFGTYKGRTFFEFYPEMAYMKECDPIAQKQFAQIVYS